MGFPASTGIPWVSLRCRAGLKPAPTRSFALREGERATTRVAPTVSAYSLWMDVPSAEGTAFAGMAGLPDYGDWVVCDSVVGGDDEGVVGDGLCDDDAVEGVAVDVRELEDA